jgi:hypothetical protein
MAITELQGSGAAPTAGEHAATPSGSGLAPGARVEVRRRFDAKWARGFEVLERSGEDYRLRRLSDGAALPVLFNPDDVRPEKRNNSWWY